MSAPATAIGERLPYLLSKLKAPRVLERLPETAARAREQGWPYEQFLETLLEAEVFARDASGARQRIRHAALPAHKTLEDFDFKAQPGAERPLILHLAQLAWITEHSQRLLLRPARSWFTVHLSVQGVSSGSKAGSGTLMASPLRRPRVTWMALSSPRWTLCNTVWRAQPSERAASASER